MKPVAPEFAGEASTEARIIYSKAKPLRKRE